MKSLLVHAALALTLGASLAGTCAATPAETNGPLHVYTSGSFSGVLKEIASRYTSKPGKQWTSSAGRPASPCIRGPSGGCKLARGAASRIQSRRRSMLKTSARNQIPCRVTAVHEGAVNDSIELQVPGGQQLVATITRASTRQLGLEPGSEVVALIKASLVIVALPQPEVKLSARNVLAGRVSRLTPGAVNAEVNIDLDGGDTMTSIITLESAHKLGLEPGTAVLAVVKASTVILAVVA